MLTVAVYHTDERRQQTAAVQLLGAMRQHRVVGKVYTVQNVNTFRRDVENSRFDIICLYTGVPDVEEWLQQEGPEIILLDTPVQELGHYLRYKPAAWLPNDKASARWWFIPGGRRIWWLLRQHSIQWKKPSNPEVSCGATKAT